MGLDGVEIVMSWEASLGLSIPDAAATSLFTPRKAIDYLADRLSVREDRTAPCLSMRAFHIIRRCFVNQFALPTNAVRPTSRLRSLVPKGSKRQFWHSLNKAIGAPYSTTALRIPLLGPLTRTVRDLMLELLSCHASGLVSLHERWTRHQIRQVIHASLEYQVAVTKFSEDDEFVKDMGIS